jgi:hypothetical protein
MSEILVEVELIKRQFKSSKIAYEDINGRQVLTVDNKSLVEQDGKCYMKCSNEPIEGSKKIEIFEDDILKRNIL